VALGGLSLTAVGAMGVRYVLLPSIHAGHLYVPSPLAWLATLAVAIVVLPELYLLLKAANAKEPDAYERYRDLMMRWPYALVTPLIAVTTKALPRRFFGQNDPYEAQPAARTGEVLYTEEQVREMLAMPLNRIYALLVDRDILSMTNEELRRVADEVAAVQREARWFGRTKPPVPSATGWMSPP